MAPLCVPWSQKMNFVFFLSECSMIFTCSCYCACSVTMAWERFKVERGEASPLQLSRGGPDQEMASRSEQQVQAIFNLPNILEELSTVRDKTQQIAIQLGLPLHEVRQFKKEDDPLSRIIERWLGGNVPGGKPLCWQSVVDVLNTDYVGEFGLAIKIHKKHVLNQGISSAPHLEVRTFMDSPQAASVSDGSDVFRTNLSASSATVTAEKPRYDDTQIHQLSEAHRPDNEHKAGAELKQIKTFCKEGVKIILQTVNEDEYKAALTFMSPLAENFPKPVVYKPGMVVGMFAGRKTALVKTEPGSKCQPQLEKAIRTFPKAKYIISVGVGYAFNKAKCKLADVLVTNEIRFFGQAADVMQDLKDIFCTVLDCTPFPVSMCGRPSKIFCGAVCSYHNSQEIIGSTDPTAEVGCAEGGVLLQLQREEKIRGVIVVKGISDYGDGKNEKDWQFTAAMAAFHYAKEKLGVPNYSSEEDMEVENGREAPPQSPVLQERQGGEAPSQIPVSQGRRGGEAPAQSPVPQARRVSADTDTPSELSRQNVLRELLSITQEWMSLGLALKIPYHHLLVIEADYPHSISKCREKMVEKWFQQASQLSWHTLYSALRDPLVERHDIANCIERKYLS